MNNSELFHEGAFIDGRWIQHAETVIVTNPVNDDPVGAIPKCDAKLVEEAISSSDKAFHNWKNVSPQQRSKVLLDWHRQITENAKAIASIMTTEQGKPLKEAEEEVAYAASFLEWFGEEAKRIYGDVMSAPVKASDAIVVVRQPIGVVASITPWNFPLAMITRKAGAAIAAGCTVIIKPSSKTPFTAIAAVSLAVKAGIPPGVINLITGDAEKISKQLADDPRVRLISFTGSTSVGKTIMANCSKNLTKVALELGGNAPFIVFNDANIDKAVEGAVASKLRNNGQTCVCPNRFYIHTDVYDAFCERLAKKLENFNIGDGKDDAVQLGPLMDDKAVEKVENHIADAIAKGARLYYGDKEHIPPRFFKPVVLIDVPNTARICHEETFGPVFALFRFDADDEVLKTANDTKYGLASYFYTNDLTRSIRIGRELQYGIVGINTGMISVAAAPFGGVKESGIGREGSRHGIDEYTEIKYLNVSGGI